MALDWKDAIRDQRRREIQRLQQEIGRMHAENLHLLSRKDPESFVQLKSNAQKIQLITTKINLAEKLFKIEKK